MAIDEALLRGVAGGGSCPALRIYGWQPPAVSIGYSQDAADVLDTGRSCRRAKAPFVRRITGGGAIYHDRELTYSFACSKEDLGIGEKVASSYRTVAAFLVGFYRRLGLEAAFACEAAERLRRPAEASGLCYASREKYDIVIGGRKVGGSAQRRSRGVIFQHGSIPLEGRPEDARPFLRDKDAGFPAKPASLGELLGRVPEREELARILAESFVSAFALDAEPGGLTGRETEMAAMLRDRKYGSDEWNVRRMDPVAAPEGDGDPTRAVIPVMTTLQPRRLDPHLQPRKLDPRQGVRDADAAAAVAR